MEVFCSEQIGLRSLLFDHVEPLSWNAGGVLARVAGREAPSWSSVRAASRNSLAGSPHHLQLLLGEKDCGCVSPSRTVGPGNASRARRRCRGTWKVKSLRVGVLLTDDALAVAAQGGTE